MHYRVDRIEIISFLTFALISLTKIQIDNLTKQGKIPIIVGGTNYYIESIVYQILVEHTEDAEELLWDKSKRKRDFDVVDEGGNKRIANDSDDSENSKETSVTTAESKEKDESTSQSGVEDDATSLKDEEKKNIDAETLKHDVDNQSRFTNEELHSRLKAIDPVMASRLHPNNRRKVLR